MTENQNSIVIDSNITGRMFAKFAMYDTFVRRKGWRPPLAFMLLMTAFALPCFTVLKDREQASLLGIVLLSVGIVLPTVWVLMYIFSVRSQIKRHKLSIYRTQYRVELSEKNIRVARDKETADYAWEKVWKLVDEGDCAFLYVDKAKAFILPKNEQWPDVLQLAERKLGSAGIQYRHTKHI